MQIGYGHKGEDIYLKVPVGTTIIDEDTGLVMADLETNGQNW